MKIDIEELTRMVKTNMEELSPEWESEVLQTDSVGIERYIEAKLPEAIRQVLLSAPSGIIEAVPFDSTLLPQKKQDGSGMVHLPDDWMRMILFKMKGWNRAVTAFLTEEDPFSACQQNLFLRGGSSKPVCVVGHASDGRLALFYYSLPAYVRVHEIEQALYLPVPKAVDGTYDFPRRLMPEVCYMCAALVYDILGRPDMAAMMKECVNM
ncbi:MAG: hypothetical protein IJ338_01055 [Bacteroidaceae bacterium]|nr:hypothetical protein [Bacteroidaceae bacterium]